MKYLPVMVITALLFSGCMSANSLNRKAPAKKVPVKKAVHKPKKRNNQSEDPLFDAIFHRNPQKHDDDSRLSAKEKELLRRSGAANEQDIKNVRREQMGNKPQGKNWVFGI
jgi:hypothetical protein